MSIKLRKLQNGRRQRALLNKYKRLSEIHNFSFEKPGKGGYFSHQQRSAINRIYRKYKTTIINYYKGDNAFIPATKATINRFKDLQSTNKGIFVSHKGISRALVNITLKGAGKSAELKIEYQKRIDIYVPKPERVNFEKWLAKIIKRHKPENVVLGVGNNVGNIARPPEAMLKYLQEINHEIVSNYKRKRKKQPFTGAYMVWGKQDGPKRKCKLVTGIVKKKLTKKRGKKR